MKTLFAAAVAVSLLTGTVARRTRTKIAIAAVTTTAAIATIDGRHDIAIRTVAIIAGTIVATIARRSSP